MPLEWLLLKKDEHTVLAITKKIIEHKKFGSSNPWKEDWSNSNLNKWLNYEFYNTAFNNDEKEQMLKIDSIDNVSLLSKDEAQFFYTNSIIYRESNDYDKQCCWTKSFRRGYIYVTRPDGWINKDCTHSESCEFGVRPVILLNTDI